MQQVMITTAIHPDIAQQLILCSSIHVSYSAPDGTAISLGAACLPSVIAARARDTQIGCWFSLGKDTLKQKTANRRCFRRKLQRQRQTSVFHEDVVS